MPAARAAAVAAAAFSRLCASGDARLGGERVVTRRTRHAARRRARRRTRAARRRRRRRTAARRSAASRRCSARRSPCRSRWSGSRFRSTAISGVERVDVLELERRELAHDPRVGRDGADERGQRTADVARDLDGPRPPSGRRRRAARSSSSCRSSRSRRGSGSSSRRAPSSISLQTGTPRDSRLGPRAPSRPELPGSSRRDRSPVAASPPRLRGGFRHRARGASPRRAPRRGRNRRPRRPRPSSASDAAIPGARETDDEDAPAGELAHLTKAGRTAGSRGRRARSPMRRRSRRRSRSAP